MLDRLLECGGLCAGDAGSLLSNSTQLICTMRRKYSSSVWYECGRTQLFVRCAESIRRDGTCAVGRTDIDWCVHNNKFRSRKKKKKNIVRIQKSWLEELLVIILTQQLYPLLISTPSWRNRGHPGIIRRPPLRAYTRSIRSPCGV